MSELDEINTGPADYYQQYPVFSLSLISVTSDLWFFHLRVFEVFKGAAVVGYIP